HPTKAWVRFRNPRLLQEMVFAAVQDALRTPAVVGTLEAAAPGAIVPGPLEAPAGAGPAGEAQPGLFQEAAAPWGRSLFGRVLGLDGGGDGVVRLRAVPALLQGQAPRRLVERLLDELRPSGGKAPEVDRVLSFVACRAAIKANERLAPEEMERLIADLSLTET